MPSSPLTPQPLSPNNPMSSPISIRTPRKQEQLSLTREECPAIDLPDWAQPPSALEAVMYCHGLGGAALQARTVDPNRKQPANCHEPAHEDLSAAWPRETHDDLSQLDRNTVKLGIVKNAIEDYFVKRTDHLVLYTGLHSYQQRYMPLTGPGQHPTLPQIWNESLQSRQGLVRDLVADVSDIPAQVMLLPIRIQMGREWRDTPAKTVLLVDMRQQDWLPKDQSLRLAYRCKATLKRHGVHDVEVEVRAVPSRSWEAYASSSPSGSTASSSQPKHATDTLRELKKARLSYIKEYMTQNLSSLSDTIVESAMDALDRFEFSSLLKDVGTMGLQISPPDAKSGTMGLILRLQGDKEHPERIVGLTCNHVVRRPLRDGRWPTILEPYLQPAAGLKSTPDYEEEGSRDMYLSHPKVLSSLHNAFNNAIEEIRVHTEALARQACMFSDEGNDQADQMFVDLQNQERALKDLEALRDNIPQDCCRLGEVFAAGAYGAIVEMPETRTSPSTRFLSDWALINIEPRYYTATQSELSESPWLAWLNRLNARIGHILPPDWRVRSHANPQYWTNTLIKDPNDGRMKFLRISRVVNTPHSHVSNKVAKHGAATGFTLGDTVGAPAVIPRPNPKKNVASEDEFLWCTQLVVVGKSAETPFSKRGDSGSAVINEDSQVMGMLVRGLISAEPLQAGKDKEKEEGKAEENKSIKDERTEEEDRSRDERKARQRVNELVGNSIPASVEGWLVCQLREYSDHDLTFVVPIEAVLEDIYNVTKQHAEIA